MTRTERYMLIECGSFLNKLGLSIVDTVLSAGGTDNDVYDILKDRLLRKQIGLLVTGQLKLEILPCQKNVPHLIPRWLRSVVEDVEPHKFDPEKLRFLNYLRDDEKYIDGETMRKRAQEMKANFGLSDVPALLAENGRALKGIATEMEGEVNRYLRLTGTVLSNQKCGLFFPELYLRDGKWELHFEPLHEEVTYGDGRLISCE